MSTKTIFFDAATSGHHGEFMENLIYGLSDSLENTYIIIVHPDLRTRLDLARADCDSNVVLHYLDATQTRSLERSTSLFERGRIEVSIVKEACIKFEARRVVMMHMNIHQYALITSLRMTWVSIRGVLLNPYTPLRRAYGWDAKLFAAFTSLRKRLQFRLMLCNQQIDRIFLLNDTRVAEALNRSYPRRLPFAPIVDPIPAVSSFTPMTNSLAKKRGDRYTFLLIGSMAPRKGCLLVLKAMQKLTSHELTQIRLRIVGKFGIEWSVHRSEVLVAIKQLQSKCSQADIELEDRHIDFFEMGVELMSTDCVLLPYVGFYGSSGVLGHACRTGKPIIACKEGLIGELVRNLDVGLTVDPRDVEAFCRCLRIAQRGDLPFDKKAASRYAMEADYKKFSETLIADWDE